MLFCFGQLGEWSCPLKDDCFRHTQPTPGRDRFAELPYDFQSQRCSYFVSNRPTEDFLRTSAYFLWVAAGRPDGDADRFWHQAQRRAQAAFGTSPTDPTGP
jgi:hypothetical protein